jgi:hypothetical protein
VSDAALGGLVDHVLGVVDNVGIRCQAAGHGVGAGAPSSVFWLLLQVMTLLAELPVPLMAKVPVSVRFSILARRRCCR